MKKKYIIGKGNIMANQFFKDLIISYLFILLLFLVISLRKTIIFKLENVYLDIRRNYKEIYKILNILSPQIYYLTFIIFVFIERKFHFFVHIDSSQKLSTWLGIMSIYGIFLAFVQFIIGFAMQSKNDFYWGTSKTKFILLESFVYKLFNSQFFRIILVYISIYTLLDMKLITDNIDLYGYVLLVDDIFSVSVTLILMTYIFLFIKCIKIKINLFSIHEGNDYYIKRKIEVNIKNYFETLFNLTLDSEDSSYFDDLQHLLKSSAVDQRADMLYKIVIHTYNNVIHNVIFNKKFSENKNEFLKINFLKSKRKLSLYYVNSTIAGLWEIIETEELKYTIPELLVLYIKQEETLFTLQKLISINYNNDFLKFVESRNKRSHQEKNILGIPEIILNNIKSLDDVRILIRTVENSPAFNACRNIEINEKEDLFSDLIENVENEYRQLINKILRNMNLAGIENFDKSRLFDAFNLVNNRVASHDVFADIDEKFEVFQFDDNYISKIKQEQILDYLIWMDNNDSNKKFLEFITYPLDYKYVVAYCVYRMLYTGSEQRSWKEEVELLATISYKKYKYAECDYSLIKDYVISFIEASNIGHRIKNEVVASVFDNLYSVIDNKLISYLVSERYIDLLVFLKLRYILKDSLMYDPYIKEYENQSMSFIDKYNYDLRYNIICSFIDEPNLLKIAYFREHYLQFISNAVIPSIPENIFQDKRIQLFLIGFEFKPIVKVFEMVFDLKDRYIIGNGVIDYFVISLYIEEFYDLLKNNALYRSYFLTKVEKSLEYHDCSVEDYIIVLQDKANEVSASINKRQVQIVHDRLCQLMIE